MILMLKIKYAHSTWGVIHPELMRIKFLVKTKGGLQRIENLFIIFFLTGSFTDTPQNFLANLTINVARKWTKTDSKSNIFFYGEVFTNINTRLEAASFNISSIIYFLKRYKKRKLVHHHSTRWTPISKPKMALWHR
jgi:hypothetical protein